MTVQADEGVTEAIQRSLEGHQVYTFILDMGTVPLEFLAVKEKSLVGFIFQVNAAGV